MARILITGARGMLGAEVVSFLGSLHKVQYKNEGNAPTLITLGHSELDIVKRDAVLRSIEGYRPKIIINCAAYTDVDGCEENEQLAFAVNADGPKNLAEAVSEFHARLIHISTDFVFDGEKGTPYVESDSPNPLNVYGCSKLEGERAVQMLGGNYVIIRTAWLYGRHGRNFVDTMQRLAEERDELPVVDDEIGSPTYAVDLAKAIWSLIESNCSGIFHVANFGSCSRYEFAQSIFDITDQNANVRPISSSEFNRAAKVPKNSTLDCSKFHNTVGRKMRPWREALEDYLSQ